MINYTVKTIQTNDVVSEMEREMLDFLKSNTKQKVNNYVKYNHTGGKQAYVFSIPGIDPKTLKVINKNRNITILNMDKVVGVVTTYDQIDSTEISVEYKFGQLLVYINPNTEKYKEYEIKINVNWQ